MCAYGKNLVALKMSFHNIMYGRLCRTHKSYIKHVTELQAAGRRICSDPAGINTAVLIFQSDLVLPISVQILHISHSLPVSTPLFQQITIITVLLDGMSVQPFLTGFLYHLSLNMLLPLTSQDCQRNAPCRILSVFLYG